MNRRPVALLAVAVLLWGCGGDDSVDPEAMVELVADKMAAEEEADPSVISLSAAEAECAARAAVNDIGAERYHDLGYDPDAGVAPDDGAFTEAEMELLYKAVTGCVDLVVKMAASMAASQGLTEEQSLCFARALDEAGIFKKLFLAGNAATPEIEAEAQEVLDRAVPECTAPGA